MSFLERVRLIFWTATPDNDKRFVKFPLIAFQVHSRLARELFNRSRDCDTDSTYGIFQVYFFSIIKD